MTPKTLDTLSPEEAWNLAINEATRLVRECSTAETSVGGLAALLLEELSVLTIEEDC